MKEGLKIFGIAFLILLGFYVLGFFVTGGELAIYKFWAPKIEDARREVFEETQSFVHGKNTYIARLQLQYESAEGEQKEAIRRLVLEEASTISDENLTPSNRAFIRRLR